jgi:CO/xanthine dehydrogenase FAD-binding subunit
MSSRYFEPASINEAAALLAEHPDADLVAGGTDLVVGDRQGKRPLGDTLVAIHRLSDLRGLSEPDAGGLRIGALVTHAEIVASPVVQERWSALSDASVLVGSPATRNAGTLGGNVANGSPAMDTGSPLLVFDASVELTAATGTRSLPLVEFFEGPAKTARAPGELVTGIDVPPLPAGRVGSAYVRLEYRRAMEIAVVGAAGLIALDEGDRIVEGRVALTAVAPVCLRVPESERLLADQSASAEVVARAGEAAAVASSPIDDVRASAVYRRAMVSVITQRALERALARAREAA